MITSQNATPSWLGGGSEKELRVTECLVGHLYTTACYQRVNVVMIVTYGIAKMH